MVDNILEVFILIYVVYACFMVSPFGIMLLLYEDQNNKPNYSIIILFIFTIPAILACRYVGIVK